MRALRPLSPAWALLCGAGCANVPDGAPGSANAGPIRAEGVAMVASDEAPAAGGGLTGRPAMPLAPWVLTGVFAPHAPHAPPEAGIDAAADGRLATDSAVRHALVGRWQRRASWTERDGTHVQRECLLDVRDDGADEECSDAYVAAEGVPAPCTRSGRARARVTAATYEWGVSSGDVHFNPGPGRVVRDTGCEPEAAEAFPVMRGRWDGGTDRMELIGTSTSSGVGPLVYVRVR